MPSPGGAAGRSLIIDATFGVAGDMLLGALLDAGADEAFVRACVEAVVPGTVEVRVGRTTRAGMAANTLDVVLLREDQPHRPWSEVRGLLEAADGIPDSVRDRALRVFTVLAEAEGAVHGVVADEVQFHEVGAWDSITDVVGVAAALHDLGVQRVQTLPLSVGTGTVRAAHGIMPVPVPAVLELLTRSGLAWQALPPGAEDTVAVASATSGRQQRHEHERQHDHEHHDHRHDHDEHEHHHDHESGVAAAGSTDRARVGELATPTGVAVLAALAEPVTAEGAGSARRAVARGIGAGRKNFTAWPNVVRVTVTEPAGGASAAGGELDSSSSEVVDRPGASQHGALVAERLCVLEANLDDVDPRVWPSVLDGLLAAGARDAWLTPLLGKKGRGGHTVHVLVDPREHDQAVFVDMLLDSTGTLGVRTYDVQRFALARAWATVPLPAPMTGGVRVKYGHRDDLIVHVTPEYEDCAAAARLARVPVLHVLNAARAAADASGLRPGHRLHSI